MNLESGNSGHSSPFARRALKRFFVLSAIGLFPICVFAQDATPPPPPPDDAGAPPNGAPSDSSQGQGDTTRTRRSDTRADGTPRRAFDPDQMMAALRKRLEVTDDAEWALISARITSVFQLQRAGGGFRGGFRPAPPGGDAGGGARRGGGSPETDALRDAITNKLPDAEVKARLERFREVRKENDAKLDKAREDLRAVLSVRQEAMLVMMGLLN